MLILESVVGKGNRNIGESGFTPVSYLCSWTSPVLVSFIYKEGLMDLTSLPSE